MNNWDITKSMGYSILKLSRHVTRDINKHIATMDDVTMKQGAVLYFVARSHTQDLIQQDIAELMDMNKSAILKTIDILEKKGFIKRMPIPDDRRKNRLEVTPAGLTVVDAFILSIKEKEEELRANVTEADLKSFFKVMEVLQQKIS